MNPVFRKVIISIPALRKLLQRVENSPIGYRLAHGAFWSVFGSAISRFIQLGASVFIARILGKAHYGELGIIQSTIGMFGIFAGFGMGLVATKYVAEFRVKNPVRAGNIISLCYIGTLGTAFLVSILLFFFSPWLAIHSLNNPTLTGLLQLSSLLLFLNAVNAAHTGMLSGFEAFKRISTINWVSGFLTFPIMVGMTYFWGVKGAVIGMIVGGVFNWGMNFVGIRREALRAKVPFNFLPSSFEWEILWKFNVPSVVSGAIISPANWICGAMLVNSINGYSEMGAFNAANQWYASFLFIPTLLGQAALPIMSERVAAQDVRQTKKILKATIVVNFLVVTPFLLLSFVSPFIMGLYGSGFSEKWLTLVFTFFTAWIIAILTPVGQVITAVGNFWPLLVMNLGWAVVFVIMSRLLIGYGSDGLAGARLIAYLCHLMWVFTYLLTMKFWKFNR